MIKRHSARGMGRVFRLLPGGDDLLGAGSHVREKVQRDSFVHRPQRVRKPVHDAHDHDIAREESSREQPSGRYFP